MTTNGSPIDVRSAAATHVGTVRKLNEDAIFEGPEIGVYAVADGMGGHDAGDVASRAIVDVLRGMDRPSGPAHLMHAVREALSNVNNDLRALARDRGPDAVIGSTIAVVLISDVHMAGLWAGDSRIYRLRNGRLKQLSRDHSYVQELVDSGKLTPEEAETHPKGNIITRAIGAADILELDAVRDRLEPGDRLLICSDGLVRAVTDGEIERHLQSGPCDRAADSLIDEALGHGARDNVSVVIVDYGVPAVEAPAVGAMPLDDITLPPEDTVDDRPLHDAQTHPGAVDDGVDDMTILGFAGRPDSRGQPDAGALSSRPAAGRPEADPILDVLADLEAPVGLPPSPAPEPPGDDLAEQTVFGAEPPGAEAAAPEEWTDQTILGFRPNARDAVPIDPEPLHPVPPLPEPGPPEPQAPATSMVEPAPIDPAPGRGDDRLETHLGRYELRERIGVVGNADVYRAFDPMVDRPAQIKVLHVGALGGQDAARRFVKEAKALGSLRHPNIATVFDVGEAGSQPFVVTELLEGQNLADILSEGGPLTLHSALSIGLQLCNALDHAHQLGVVHRNLNPGTIVILDRGRTVKVTDFGLHSHTEQSATALAGSFPAPSAIHYLAPEALGSSHCDHRADLYAVGAVLYRMLAGRPPFEADSEAGLIAKIDTAEPGPMPADVPKSVSALVFRLLSKDPGARVPTAVQLSEAIGHEMEQLESRRTTKRRKRRGLKGWTAATALISLVLLAQSIVLGALVLPELGQTLPAVAPVDDQSGRIAVLATERLGYAVDDAARLSDWEAVTGHLDDLASDEGVSAAVLAADGGVLATAGADLALDEPSLAAVSDERDSPRPASRGAMARCDGADWDAGKLADRP